MVFKKLVIAAVAGCLLILAVTALLTRGQTRAFAITYRLIPDRVPATDEMMQRAAETVQARMKAIARSYRLRNCAARPDKRDLLRVEFRTRGEDSDVAEVLSWITMPARVEFRLLHPDPDAVKSRRPESGALGYWASAIVSIGTRRPWTRQR